MDDDQKVGGRGWGRSQVRQYETLYPRYKLYAETLQKVLYKIAKKYSPQAIVQSRPKAIASFAEKIYRKKGESSDPVHQFTDLCGGRIITSTHDEVAAISKYLEENFDIDWENSVDVSQRLKPTEFGYRSIHYIVSFKPGAFPDKSVDVPIPGEVYGLKAEVQVRTLLEHVWADFSHDLSYKRGFSLPKKWERELAGLAAVLENADGTLMRIRDGMKIYSSCYGSYMDEENMRAELDKLEAVLEYDAENADLADRIGQLAMELGDDKKAAAVLSKHAEAGHPAVLRDLGIALCKIHKDDRHGEEYRKGQRYLEKAGALSNDVRTLASYADSWAGIDDDKARELYSAAYDIDPTDPLVLCNYLEHELSYNKDVSVLGQVRSNIFAAISICRQQIDVSVNLPWAYYNLGKLYLFLGKPYESLTAYAKAIQLSAEPWMVESSLQSLYKLRPVQKQISGYEWARRLLLIGRAKWPGKGDPKVSSNDKPVESPVIILAGGCENVLNGSPDKYRRLIMEAFMDFKGTMMSSGLESGISGYVGELGERNPDIRTIGYMPRLIPSDVSKDKRYKEFRYTENEYRYVEDNGFCALETLKKWADIVSSGIKPADVKVLGIGGGRLSALEYRIAIALGAHVAVLEGSGYEAARLLTDDDWATPNSPISLPGDTMTLCAFIRSRMPIPDPILRDRLGRKIHEIYWDNQFREKITKEESMKKWDELLPYLKESNMQQADDMIQKLRQMGFVVTKSDNGVTPITFTADEVERMSEMEHGRWNAERLLDGWKYDKVKDVAKKLSPYLVSWEALPDSVREWDRQAVREIPGLLASLGYEVQRL